MQETIKKLQTYIGFSIKSNSLVFGYDNITNRPNKMKLIILCSLVSTKTQDKIINHFKNYNVSIIKLKQTFILSNIVMRENVKIVAVKNLSLSNAINSIVNPNMFEILKRGTI